ncbi:NAD-dependent epimerase/dehydratase family protein [Rhizobium ruizarguesonis]|jgi:uncharacterized protein YbjT (DUF2867 family)|uniref:NAD(P)H-binding protein n=1 Tax=Rhizobium ruizarguesonis TaxID=2081791 RepID=UPI001032172E|nr:NAD(P)H-binding protein [Rhizobium ruizarguesonis]NEH75667.1 NAD(P)H-binding protein [Rhizobium ruizarguesonis]NEJ16699.1 NAD(P)H-binding protein [Rhizobium ruizarguesonis]NEJ85493.1 NAD(P)H-binding protein [Rhizobium ruizarguesonis]NEJ96959.1 NAD(P)H-binding protein [Rhizobium ruizarguesonis]NEK30481.1 NAD(P)H-binding protein [Rhizobium ruizarguesonis]
MKIFIIGVTGGVGERTAKFLLAKGHEVSAIVRDGPRASKLEGQGITPYLDDVVKASVVSLADRIKGSDIVLFTAGAGGHDGSKMTTAVDGDGPAKVAQAAKIAGTNRFYLVSVFPEAGRDRGMGDEFEHYMVEKKKAETQLVLTDLDWVILRPSTLTNHVGAGTVDLGLAKMHVEISRDDVAATLVALMENPSIVRVILEATGGTTPIADAVTEVGAQLQRV